MILRFHEPLLQLWTQKVIDIRESRRVRAQLIMDLELLVNLPYDKLALFGIFIFLKFDIQNVLLIMVYWLGPVFELQVVHAEKAAARGLHQHAAWSINIIVIEVVHSSLLETRRADAPLGGRPSRRSTNYLRTFVSCDAACIGVHI